MRDNKDRHLTAHDKPIVFEMRLIGQRSAGARVIKKRQNKPVVMCDKETRKSLRTFKSLVQASDETGIGASNISKVARGMQLTAGGYHWKFGEHK